MKHKTENKLQIIYQEEESESRWLDFVWEVCLVFVLQMGVLQFLFTWTQMQPRSRVVCIAVTFACAFVQVLLHYLTQGNRYSRLFAPCVIVALLIIRRPQSVYYGLFGVLNYIIGWWNQKENDAVSLVMQTQITQADIVSFVLVFSILLSMLAWRTVRNKDVANTMPIPLLLSVTGLVINRFSMVGCSLFFIGWVGIWLSRIRTRASLRRTIWLIALSLILLLVAAGNRGGQLDAAVHLKDRVKQTILSIRYGSDTLPEGKLSEADKLLDGDDARLQVTTQQVKSMYLRGFVGGTYTDGSWETLPKASYKGENSGMLAWLGESGLEPQSQYAEYTKVDVGSQITQNTVTIQNVGANRRYVYAPYSAESVSGRGITEDQDNNYVSHAPFGKKNYTYNEWSGTRPGELLYANPWVKNPATTGQVAYLDAESVYAGFVYANYLAVDPAMEKLLQSEFFDGWEEEPTVYYTTERIRDVLSKKMSYKEEPELAPEGTEPISWALNQGHEGNAVLFASAAVLAYRIQGIPARYVEGYLLTEQAAAESKTGNVTLTSKNSHAWVEVYLDGAGWIPIDVTPGFYYDSYTLLEMVQKPDKVKHTAAEEEKDQQSQRIEDERKQDENKAKKEKNAEKHPVYLDVCVYILLAVVILLTLAMFRYVFAMMLYEKRYRRLSGEEQTTETIAKIYRLLGLYGCRTKPGWNVEQTDAELADRFDACVPGEYIRIASIIEKHVFGQEALTAAEIRTLYLYAQKLYEARKKQSMGIRLRCILSTKYLCGDGDDCR